MSDAAKSLYDSIESVGSIRGMISAGEAEGLYLECKAPRSPEFTQAQQNELAEVVSAFTNTAGGVLLYGVQTVRQGELDVLKQITYMAEADDLFRAVADVIPRLTSPPITTAEVKVVRESPTDTKGVVVVYVPHLTSDPVQANKQGQFFFRAGGRCAGMPYEIIKRLFAATESPDLAPLIPAESIRLVDYTWVVPISVENRSSAVAEHAVITVEVEVPAYVGIHANLLFDVSDLHGGRRVLSWHSDRVVHKGLWTRVDQLHLGGQGPVPWHGVATLWIRAFANKMRAREWMVRLTLEPDNVKVEMSPPTDLP